MKQLLKAALTSKAARSAPVLSALLLSSTVAMDPWLN
jgi:hypothetical protein